MIDTNKNKRAEIKATLINFLYVFIINCCAYYITPIKLSKRIKDIKNTFFRQKSRQVLFAWRLYIFYAFVSDTKVLKINISLKNVFSR